MRPKKKTLQEETIFHKYIASPCVGNSFCGAFTQSKSLERKVFKMETLHQSEMTDI